MKTDSHPDLNTLLIQKGFLALARARDQSFEPQAIINVSSQLTAQLLESGVLVFEPLMPGSSDIVLSCGVHGNETAPIEILDQMVKAIIAGQLTVKNRLMILLGNPKAMNQESRFVDENLNRLFVGKHQKSTSYEATRAAKLERHVDDFYSKRKDAIRYHYDLHTAIRGSIYSKFAIYPFPDGRAWNRNQLGFIAASGFGALLLGHQPSGTFSYFSSHRYHAHAFTLELGQVRPFGENNHAEFQALVKNLEALVSDEPAHYPTFDSRSCHVYQVKCDVLKKSEDFSLNLSEGVKNFTSFKAGYQLATDSMGGYQIEVDGEAIVFPNAKVPVGQRAGLIVTRTDL